MRLTTIHNASPVLILTGPVRGRYPSNSAYSGCCKGSRRELGVLIRHRKALVLGRLGFSLPLATELNAAEVEENRRRHALHQLGE
jgi:hypothetical protein